MPLTREQLEALGLPEEQIGQVLALDGEAAAARDELEARLRSAKERGDRLARRELERSVKEALLLQGAEGWAVPLLMKAIDLDRVEPAPDGDGPLDLSAVLAPVREAYGQLFAREERVGQPVLAPLTASRAMTREDVLAMSPEDIVGHWDAVKAALG